MSPGDSMPRVRRSSRRCARRWARASSFSSPLAAPRSAASASSNSLLPSACPATEFLARDMCLRALKRMPAARMAMMPSRGMAGAAAGSRRTPATTLLSTLAHSAGVFTCFCASHSCHTSEAQPPHAKMCQCAHAWPGRRRDCRVRARGARQIPSRGC